MVRLKFIRATLLSDKIEIPFTPVGFNRLASFLIPNPGNLIIPKVMTVKKITYKPVLTYQNRMTRLLWHEIVQQKLVLQAIQLVLPENLAKQVKHCLIKNQGLLVYTDSAVWASQLRFYSTMMQVATAPLTATPITEVLIRIITQPAGFVARTERKARLPSPEKIAELQKDSLSITDELLRLSLLELGETLLRLSRQNAK